MKKSIRRGLLLAAVLTLTACGGNSSEIIAELLPPINVEPETNPPEVSMPDEQPPGGAPPVPPEVEQPEVTPPAPPEVEEPEVTPPAPPVMDDPVEFGEFDGSSEAVADFYTPSQVAAIESLGLQINLGDTPPNVEGVFRRDPSILQATSVPNDSEIGAVFNPITITFSNQSGLDLSVETIADSGDTASLSSAAAISGSGNAFTVYSIVEVTVDGHTFQSAETYSGIVTANGIENLQTSILVIDDRGDPNDAIIGNDTGRLLVDGDGISENIAEESGSFDGSLSALANVYTEAEIATIQSLGLQINFGDNPPDVTGTFALDPSELQATSDPDDNATIGSLFTPNLIGFSNINTDVLELDVAITDLGGFDIVNVTDAFISGSGNAFTVFALAELPLSDGSIVNTRESFSGIVTDTGIQSLQWALMVLDSDTGDIVFGRLFVDQDGFSEQAGGSATAGVNGISPDRLKSRMNEGLVAGKVALPSGYSE